MRLIPRLAFLSILLLLSSCETPQPPIVVEPDPSDRDRLTQISVINALMLGRYDGVMSMDDVLAQGDFGLGTLDHLDGELIILDGKAYQVRADGAVVEVNNDETTPFVVVTHFDEDGKITLPAGASLEELNAHLDKALGRPNTFFAIRAKVRFTEVKLRSVPRQEPPYRPLAEVAESQTTWTQHDISGTLIGIRCPSWTDRLNVPGYHWHFLSDDKKIGGHVLACELREGMAQYDACDSWLIELGDAGLDKTQIDSDLGDALRKVEGGQK